jgi:putative hydrolase of HD superfamily
MDCAWQSGNPKEWTAEKGENDATTFSPLSAPLSSLPSMLSLALHAAQMKRIPRMGWVIRGAPLGGQPENVAAHSYGVVFITLLLLDATDVPLDRERTLRMAIVHDLAESLIGDLPRPLRRFISDETKHAAEHAALNEILTSYPHADALREAWEEYHAGTSAEAQVVKDADRLDMMIQAFLYEQAGQKNLDDFWQSRYATNFNTPTATTMFTDLLAKRTEMRNGH